jgi:hypothetical protein
MLPPEDGMADDLAEELKRNIPLSEMIQSLRQELRVALAKGEGEPIRFEVTKVELELQIAVSREKGAEGKLKFSVLEAGAKAGKAQQDTHLFRLELKPEKVTEEAGQETTGPLKVSAQERARPEQG